ncbi:MAG: hypothetical protein GYB64_19085 [Chloroflexi bacterium]|nr:hypothetical protein [Chloroflexota bacterium]
MIDDLTLPVLWAVTLMDAIAGVYGDEAAGALAGAVPLDDHATHISLDAFVDMQQGVVHIAGMAKAPALLEEAGEACFTHLRQQPGIRMPRGRALLARSDPRSPALAYFADYIDSLIGQAIVLEETETAWNWIISPYPLMSQPIRGFYERGMVRALTAEVMSGEPLPVRIAGRLGGTAALLLRIEKVVPTV